MRERSKEEEAIIQKYAKALSQVLLGYKEIKDCEELLDSLGTKYNKVDVSRMLGFCDVGEVTKMALIPVVYTGWKHYGLSQEKLNEVYRKACENLCGMSPMEMEKEMDAAGIMFDETMEGAK